MLNDTILLNVSNLPEYLCIEVSTHAYQNYNAFSCLFVLKLFGTRNFFQIDKVHKKSFLNLKVFEIEQNKLH